MSEMDGYVTSYINLITDNLRDRYENGFPVIKELLQNADDSGAKHFVFGLHEGFANAENSLLQGAGLWFFNDGQFQKTDRDALRSFGINTKAGDATAIGKFGLGMKSVFHLCEALFYYAYDGDTVFKSALTPWKQDGKTIHPEWDEVSDADWMALATVATQFGSKSGNSGFLLWLPLRRKAHLKNAQGDEVGAIISRFPGDDPSIELGFLNEADLKVKIAEVLPLLKNLEQIEYKSANTPFSITLEVDSRLMTGEPRRQSSGRVVDGDGVELLRFTGIRDEARVNHQWFEAIRKRDEWPRSRYRDELGHEKIAPDKSVAEGAVLITAVRDGKCNSLLSWAVFLPLEEGRERLDKLTADNAHTCTLHGQFFVDAGRKGIHSRDALFEDVDELPSSAIDESALNKAWNQRLAQTVVLPLLLPTLEQYVSQYGLSGKDCGSLTKAIAGSRAFVGFQKFICIDYFWVKRVVERESEGNGWGLVERAKSDQLRPCPAPPSSAPDRLWKTFPRLETMTVTPFDFKAPSLLVGLPQWTEEELQSLLAELPGLFVKSQEMDYLTDFLGDPADPDSGPVGPYLKAGSVQNAMLREFRKRLSSCTHTERQANKAKAKRLFEFILPSKRLTLGAELPDGVLKRLWQVDAPVLLIPKGFQAETPDEPELDDVVIAEWLRALNKVLDNDEQGAAILSILSVMQGLLKVLPTEKRGALLRTNPRLRVIGVRDAATGREKPFSLKDIVRIRAAGTLFGYGGGLPGKNLGKAPLLSKILPAAEVCLVKRDVYRELFPQEPDVLSADSQEAILEAVGSSGVTVLGDEEGRGALLVNANNPGKSEQAKKGLRLLLHGSIEHADDLTTRLWIAGQGQHPVWAKLWAQTYPDADWSIVPKALADAVPHGNLHELNVIEIDPANLIKELGEKGLGVKEPNIFSPSERDEVLRHIEDENLWKRLPFHTSVAGEPVTAIGEHVYVVDEGDVTEESFFDVATLIQKSDHPMVRQWQDRWLRSFDNVSRIEMALLSDNPRDYCQLILDILGHVDLAKNQDLIGSLKGSAWIPAIFGKALKPEDIIDLSGSVDINVNDIGQRYRQQLGNRFATPNEIETFVKEHSTWGVVHKHLVSTGEDGLRKLGETLSDLADYTLGCWGTTPSQEQLDLLRRLPYLPGWQLLYDLAAGDFDFATVWDNVGQRLSAALNTERLIDVCGWLGSSEDEWSVRKQIFDFYLKELVSADGCSSEKVLALKLASEARTWVVTDRLCTGANGVDTTRVLDGKQARLIHKFVHQASMNPSGSEQRELPDPLFETIKEATPKLLEDYFERWDTTLLPRGFLGVLLGLLGKSVQPLASNYLNPHTFEWYEDALPWVAPIGNSERRELFQDMQISQAMERIKVAVDFVSEDGVDLYNLKGENIHVPLKTSVTNLFAGPLNWQETYEVLIPLRRLDPGLLESGMAESIVCKTAEALYFELYQQRSNGFKALWNEFRKSDQLEIHIARRLILDHIPFYLRQLSVKSKWITQQLQHCDTKRRRIAELESDEPESGLREARQHLSQALEHLANGIDDHPADADAVAEAVKRKLRQYQYDLSSVPLELFQNADDAVVELGQMRAFPDPCCDIPGGARQFVVAVNDGSIRFMHWGRPVNDHGPANFPGSERGFDRDLEKMLVLSASDKQGEAGITGKFGLGFKCVLLACNEPRILSGRLAIRISSGILPLHWDRKEADNSIQILKKYGTDRHLMGTLIELPGLSKSMKSNVLEKFEKVAGLLCVFSRAIRKISLIDGSRLAWEWQFKELLGREVGVEVGRLMLKGTGTRTAICFRGNTGSVVVALDANGLIPLPKGIPGLWVTAPTRESAELGYAVNGDYELDAGRGRLAGDFDANLGVSKKIGTELGDRLREIFSQSQKNWSSISKALGVSDTVSLIEFWEGVWKGLSRRIPKQRTQWSHDVALLAQVALTALAGLSEASYAVPNGLNGKLQAFVEVKNIKHFFVDDLLDENVICALGAWERYRSSFAEGSVVSEFIAKPLILSEVASPVEFGIPALIALVKDKRVFPNDAAVLAQLHLATEDLWRDETVKKKLDELLFLSEQGAWALPSKLISGSSPNLEEKRRYELAPSVYRLHPDYVASGSSETSGVDFFITCRQEMNAPAELLAEWIIAAETENLRRSALEYLADGSLADEVSCKVRGQGWLESALHDDVLIQALNDTQLDSLRRRLVSTDNLAHAVERDSEEYDPGMTASIEFSEAISRISEWWADVQVEEAKKYRKSLYPWKLDLSLNPESGDYDKRDWFTLFALATFQGMGRTRDDHHRGFIQVCEDKDWWRIFVEKDPKENPDEWMNIIEEYASSQIDDEEWMQWVGQFPKMYRLRRWLDDYVELFLSMDRFNEDFDLEALLAPKANPYFQGGGIDAPPLKRTMKRGSHMVVRELLQQGVITSPLAIRHAFAPIERIRTFFYALGIEVQTSVDIYNALVGELGEEGARFGGDFDIPLRRVSNDELLQQELFS